MRRRALLGFALVALAVGYVELRLPPPVGAQGRDAVYQRLAVTGAFKLERSGGSDCGVQRTLPRRLGRAGPQDLSQGASSSALVSGGTLARKRRDGAERMAKCVAAGRRILQGRM